MVMLIPDYTDAATWQRDRTRFNHDWLMVSFLTFLQAWRADLDAAGRGGPLPPEAMQHLQEWPRRRQRLQALLDAAEQALGPAGQKGGAGLALDLPAPSLLALLERAQVAWCERSGIRMRVRELNDMAVRADGLVQCLLRGEDVDDAGDRLYRLFLAISGGLSSLPSAGYLP